MGGILGLDCGIYVECVEAEWQLWAYVQLMHLDVSLWHAVQADPTALAAKETERAEAAAQLERRMAAMEAVLAARRTPIAEAKPEAARGPGADLRFQVNASWHPVDSISAADGCVALHDYL